MKYETAATCLAELVVRETFHCLKTKNIPFGMLLLAIRGVNQEIYYNTLSYQFVWMRIRCFSISKSVMIQF